MSSAQAGRNHAMAWQGGLVPPLPWATAPHTAGISMEVWPVWQLKTLSRVAALGSSHSIMAWVLAPALCSCLRAITTLMWETPTLWLNGAPDQRRLSEPNRFPCEGVRLLALGHTGPHVLPMGIGPRCRVDSARALTPRLTGMHRAYLCGCLRGTALARPALSLLGIGRILLLADP